MQNSSEVRLHAHHITDYYITEGKKIPPKHLKIGNQMKHHSFTIITNKYRYDIKYNNAVIEIYRNPQNIFVIDICCMYICYIYDFP